MKENEKVVDTMYLLCPKNSALDTVYATYKGALLFADVYQAKHVCLLLNRDFLNMALMDGIGIKMWEEIVNMIGMLLVLL